MSNYYITYDVPALKQVGVKSGPYNTDEVEYQMQDIAGFDGVINIRVLSEEEVQKKADEGEAIVDAVSWTD